MRFRLQIENNQVVHIPINYQYPLSAWIYGVFNRADPVFAEWLHNHGYAFNGNRQFKLFTFSSICFSDAVFISKPVPSLRIRPGNHQWQLTFFMQQAAGTFIEGLFRDQELVVAEGRQKAVFRVVGVERLPEPKWDGSASFRCMSPVVVSRPVERRGRLYAEYVSPEDSAYSQLLQENTIKRYVAAHEYIIAGRLSDGSQEETLAGLPFDTGKWSLKIKGEPKSKLQTIKSGTSQQTSVRGFVYPFTLEAPVELQRFIYHAGFGEKGSLGFGCVGVN